MSMSEQASGSLAPAELEVLRRMIASPIYDRLRFMTDLLELAEANGSLAIAQRLKARQVDGGPWLRAS